MSRSNDARRGLRDRTTVRPGRLRWWSRPTREEVRESRINDPVCRELKREVLKRSRVPVRFRLRGAEPVTVKVFGSGVDHPVGSGLPTADRTR